jgi:hypothetical protein
MMPQLGVRRPRADDRDSPAELELENAIGMPGPGFRVGQEAPVIAIIIVMARAYPTESVRSQA